MSITVNLSGRLVDACDGQDSLTSDGKTVREVLDALAAAHPSFGERIWGESGLKPYILVYLDDEDIRLLEGLDTPLPEGAELSILPAIAGGGARWS